MVEENKNTTECGEFVCSYFAWLPVDTQKEKANRLSSITNKNN